MPKYSDSFNFLWDSPSLRNLNKLIRLEEKLIEHAAEMEKRSQKTIEAMENDRKVLSKRIYDSIACTLAAVKIQLEDRIGSSDHRLPSNTMSLEKIVTHLSEAINETRKISRDMRSHSMDDFGLKPALVERIQNFKKLYPGIEVAFQIGIEEQDIAADTKTVLYRVVEEALENVGKHSEATKVRINLTVHENQIHLEFADNGSGFDRKKVLSEPGSGTGYGLHSMRERVEICKGKIHLRSKSDAGTTIGVSIPL
jgi:signal transduction histidine kinase